MLFNIEADRGDVIEGYLIPDGFSDRPSICVIGEEGEILRLECRHGRSSVLQSGRHETGTVGFRLDNTILPGLKNRRRLEIRDAKSGILVYRRPMEHQVGMKVFRMEFQMLPMMKFDHYCSGRFQYALCGMERFGQETALQAFHLSAIESIYLSGRLHLRNFEEFLDKGFTVIGYLPDPYYEMAARLTMLKRLSQTNIAFLGERDRLSMSAAAAHFAEVVLDDERSLKKALQSASPKIRDGLVSPATRQLVRTSPDQSVARGDVAPAIDLLSRFAIVGQDGMPFHFESAAAELMELPLENVPSVTRHSALEGIAERLRALTIAETLLEADLILHHYVREAAGAHALSA